MTTIETFLRTRASLVAAGLASLLGGCIIDAKIGDDPVAGTDTTDTDGEEEGSATGDLPGHTSGAEPGTASATTHEPGDDDGGATVGDEGGSGSESGADPETALELCEVPVIPPGPDDPLFIESVMCADGCIVTTESAVELDLYLEYGQCLCEAMGCGPVSGGGTGMEDPGQTDGGGDPDGCGDFPDGDASFTCACETCSIVVGDVDAAWLESEADLGPICECMCGGAGCGLPR